MTNVRGYRDHQLLDRVKKIGGTIPEKGKYLIIGVQSTEDEFNVFDDKFYVFDGPEFIMVSSGTINPGRSALELRSGYKQSGAAVWETDQWCPEVFKRGFHVSSSGKRMRALRQARAVYYYRDADKDKKAEQLGERKHGIINVNMHGVTYTSKDVVRKVINGWSAGCQVWNKMADYRKMITLTWDRNLPVDYALLKEF